MTTIADCLPGLATQSWSLVLHIGAGATGALDSHAKLSPRRLVLVEGDAEMARELSLAARALPAAEVLSHAVSPTAGELTWHRYNLRALNGPLPAAGLEAYYPRLRPISTEAVRAVAIADLVDQLLPPGATGNLLVLDVPGQEVALLEALGDERLTRFDKVLVHGRNLDTGHGHALAASMSWLKTHHVVVAPSNADAPKRLWETVTGVVDRRAVEMSHLEAQLHSVVRHRDELAFQLKSAQEAEAAARDEAAHALARTMDEHRATEAALSATLEQLRAELESERQERSRLSASLDETARQRDEHKHWHEENAKWAKALDRQLKAVQTELAEREQVLTQVEVELSQRTRTLQAAEEAARAAQVACEAELARWAQQAEADKQASAEALARTMDEHRATEAALSAKLEQLRAELESERQESSRLSTSLEETARQRDEQKHWHTENAKWAKALDGQLKAVQTELAEREQGLARVEAELAQRDQALQAAEDAARAVQAESEAELTRLAQQAVADRQAAADALDALRSDVARLQRHGEELEAQLKAAQEADAAARAAAGGALAQVLDEHRAAEAALSDALAQARAELEAERQERSRLSASLDETARQRDEHKHWHEENANWAKALDAQLKVVQQTLSAKDEELERVRVDGERVRADVDGLRSALTQAEASVVALRDADAVKAVEIAELQSRAQALSVELEQTRHSRDEQKHWHEENAKWAKALEAQLQATKEELEARVRAAQEAEAALVPLRDQVSRLTQERDTEAHWHHENAKWAQALKAELDPLKPEHERLQRELALAQRELAEARGRADSVQREMEDRDARQRLMDTEILRAEAQLDLIKEVLIREKNF
jgi:chromosome segregation ATPase